MALREDDAIEGIVKLDVHLHARAVALYVQAGDGRHDAKDVADYAKLVVGKNRKKWLEKGYKVVTN